MKRIVFIAAALFAVILAGCSSAKDNYLKVIPDNPVAMLKVNVGNILDESEILENPIVKPLVLESAGRLPQSMVELFNEIVENPGASGLDFDRPAVLAVVNVYPVKAVITVPVADSKKLEDMLYCFSDNDVEITTEGGVNIVNTYSRKVAVAYDESSFVVAIDDIGADVMEYMNLERSAADNSKYDSFFSGNDDAAMFVSGAEIFDIVSANPYFMYNVRHADDIEILKEISLLMTLNFENGYAELAVDCDVPGEYKEKYGNYFAFSTKKHLKYVPEDAFLVVDMGCNTEDALDNMSEEEIAQLNNIFSLIGRDVSDLASLSGDLTYAMYGSAESPMMMAVLDCEDPELFSSVVTTMGMFMKLEQVEENVYSMGYLGTDSYILAYLDKKVFVLPSVTFDMIKDGSGVAPLDRNALYNRLVSSMGNAALLDCDNLFAALGDNLDMGEYASLATSFESVRFEVESPTRAVLRVTIKDKEINALKFIVDNAIMLYLQTNLQ